MPVTPLLRASIVAAAVVGAALYHAAPAAAGPVASTEALAYSGTITPVNSSGAATGSAITVPGRDLALFVSQGYPGVSDMNRIVTRFSSPPANNPSNQAFGFLQIADNDASTDTSVIGGFDPSLTTFYLGVDGQNAAVGAKVLAVVVNAAPAGALSRGGYSHGGAGYGYEYDYQYAEDYRDAEEVARA